MSIRTFVLLFLLICVSIVVVKSKNPRIERLPIFLTGDRVCVDNSDVCRQVIDVVKWIGPSSESYTYVLDMHGFSHEYPEEDLTLESNK